MPLCWAGMFISLRFDLMVNSRRAELCIKMWKLYLECTEHCKARSSCFILIRCSDQEVTWWFYMGCCCLLFNHEDTLSQNPHHCSLYEFCIWIPTEAIPFQALWRGLSSIMSTVPCWFLFWGYLSGLCTGARSSYFNHIHVLGVREVLCLEYRISFWLYKVFWWVYSNFLCWHSINCLGMEEVLTPLLGLILL